MHILLMFSCMLLQAVNVNFKPVRRTSLLTSGFCANCGGEGKLGAHFSSKLSSLTPLADFRCFIFSLYAHAIQTHPLSPPMPSRTHPRMNFHRISYFLLCFLRKLQRVCAFANCVNLGRLYVSWMHSLSCPLFRVSVSHSVLLMFLFSPTRVLYASLRAHSTIKFLLANTFMTLSCLRCYPSLIQTHALT